MKKEYIYIFIMAIIFAAAYYYVNIVIKDKVVEAEKLATSIEDLSAQFERDSLIQSGISRIRASYKYNNLRKGDEFDDIIVKNSLQIEGIFKELEIEYNPNNIGSSKDEMKQKNLNFYEIDLSFTADYKKVIKFLNIIENDLKFKNVLEIDIVKRDLDENTKLGRFRGESLGMDNNEESQEDLKPKILSIDMKIQFLKIM